MDSIEKVRIQHGIFHWIMQDYCYVASRNRKHELELITPFWKLLYRKRKKWVKQGYLSEDSRLIHYTLGEKGKYQAIAITHPKDSFNRKVGRAIVSGRLEKAINGGYGGLPTTVVYMEEF